MELLWIASTAALAFWIYKLQERVDQLEEPNRKAVSFAPVIKTKDKNNEVQDDGIDRSNWPKHLQKQPSFTKQAASKITAEKQIVSEPFDLENFLGRKLFPILGATSIVIAIGFFSLWAFSNGWIGSMGRIAIGIIVSLGLVGLGEYLRPRYPDFFTSISAAGIAGLIITTLLAHYVYDFISSFQSLTLLALQAGVGIMLALRYDSRVLANFSIAAGLLAPWFTGELEPMLILPFILVISLAGFIIATQKKWPEIFVSLLLFASSYIFAALAQLTREKLDHNYTINSLDTVSSIDPIQLLVFAFIIYTLIGSAGVVRLILNRKQTEPVPEDAIEIVLFSIALLLFNMCAVGVFYAEGWSHIGFLILPQALIFLALADWFKTQKWSQFHLLTLGCSLLFILLATLWELRELEPIILTLVLALEGAFMCAVGQISQQKMYDWFGRLALLAAVISYVIEYHNDFITQILGTLILVTALMYSIGKVKNMAEKIWLGVVLFLTSWLIFEISFDGNAIPDLLQPLLPTLWFAGLAHSAYRQSDLFLRIAAALVFLALAYAIADSYYGASDLIDLSAWLWVAFSAAYLYGLQLKSGREKLIDQIIIYGALIVATLTWLFRSEDTFAEPLMTLSWLAFAAVLMTLGLVQSKWHELRYIALSVMLLIVSKLYLVDIWQWETPVRVMAFTALGLVLLSIGFFYQKLWLKK